MSATGASVSIIAALSRNRVIGKDGRMPWHLSDDLKRFKRITLGKPLVMGRRTHESIGRPLPGRLNIVVTRNFEYRAAGCEVVHSLSEALAVCGAGEAMVIGGASLYAEALPIVERLYLTLIHCDFEGDTYFPEYDTRQWREVSREAVTASDSIGFDYSFVVLERADC